MNHREALELIRSGVPAGGTWAELGAGTGTFTRALSELIGPDGDVYAVDRSDDSIHALRRIGLPGAATIHVRKGDFTGAWERLELPALDGILMANSLHFAEDQARVMRQVVNALRPGGRMLIVEYDRERGNAWVPYPVPLTSFRALAADAGLSDPHGVGRRRSRYGRTMYAALARRPDLDPHSGG